ncbi:MAG: metal ABC transporter permease [Actinomycetes bacterium]
MGLVLAGAGWQSNWAAVLGEPFMRNAFAAGGLVAIAAGLLGYFVVVRQGEFAAHALGHIGFPGATGAVLLGVSPLLGLGVFCVVGAVVIGLLGTRANERATATGTVLAMATGLGILFASLATRTTSTVTNVLFGNLLAVTTGQLACFAAFTLVLALVLAVVGRPLMLASLVPEVAEAKGVPVRALGVLFLVLMGLLVTMAVQAVGTLLLFALVVTPPATALRLTARPALVALLSTGIGLLAVGAGLVLSTMFNLPPSFFVVAVAFVVWAATLVATRRAFPSVEAVHGHDHC